MSNPPRKIQVGPHPVVVKVDTKRMHTVNKETDDVHGLAAYGHDDLEIVVDPQQAASQMRDSVLHEVLHALFAIGPQNVLFQELDEKNKVGVLEENLVQGLCPLLLDFLRRNPRFVDWLLEA